MGWVHVQLPLHDAACLVWHCMDGWVLDLCCGLYVEQRIKEGDRLLVMISLMHVVFLFMTQI